MRQETKPGVVYVLPHYDPNTGSHFFHLYELLERVAGRLDLTLVIERAASAPQGIGCRIVLQRFSFAPARFVELVYLLARERARGRRQFYVHYSFFGAVAAWLVAAVSGGTVYYWNAGMPWLYRRPWFEEAVFRFALRHTNLVTGTERLAMAYAREYQLTRHAVRILPNWVNVGRFHVDESETEKVRQRLHIAPHAKTVLFVHRLSRRKGALHIPAIAAGVTAGCKDAIFVIVGAGPEAGALARNIKARQLENVVRCVGEIPHQNIPAYFSAADVFFMPSEEEGFPHVLPESLAAGVPYVASNVGGVSEITPPELASYIVPSGDIDGFVKGIIALLNMPESARSELRSALKHFVGQYDVSRAAQTFCSLFT